MKKWIIAGAALFVLLGLGGGGYALVNSLASAADDEFLDGDASGQREIVEVELGDISSVLVLDATVRAEPGEDVRARNGGRVTQVWVQDGEQVDTGAPVVNLAVPNDSADAGGDGDDDGGGAPATTEITLRAPDSGKVTGLDLEVGEDVEPGAVLATVAPDEYRAVATVPANDLFRFYEDPSDISFEIDQGPPAESCDFISLGDDDADGARSDDEDAGGGGGDASGDGVELSCRVTSELDVFAGIQGKLSVVTGEADDVLLVPVTAVRGNVASGEVIVVQSDGSEEVREVELGVSDGTNIEVTDGLDAGDEVVNPVPLDERFDVPDAYDEDEDDEFYEEGF